MNSPVIYLKIVGPDGRWLRDFYADGHVVFPWREEADRERLGKTVWSVSTRQETVRR